MRGRLVPGVPMHGKQCSICGAKSARIAANLGVCLACIRTRPEKCLEIAAQVHRLSRRRFGLPGTPPREPEGKLCGLCSRECRIQEGERGFCGLRTVRDGQLVHLAGTPRRGLVHWYRDPLPTNCVADWVCSGHRMLGSHNLAVFYASCTFDCLFCQNWHYRQTVPMLDDQGSVQALSSADLAAAADERSYCVCYFGGDPASQMPHALASAKMLAEQGVVVCWETAGTMHPRFLRRALELSLRSGGCLKFDLKAHDENLNRVLTGASNRRTLENFASAAARIDARPAPPLVVASTLLVPGYVDAHEVGQIARFIAALNPSIPYALLGFHPHFEMMDLPRTSLQEAEAALRAAQAEGLERVRLGNIHLLHRE